MATRIFDQNNDPVIPAEAVASPDQQVADVFGNIINPSKEDGNLLSVKTNTDNLDILLSSRASEATLSAIKTQTDLLTFDTGRLVVDGSQVTQPIQGVDAVGGAISEIPLTVAGIDDSGNKQIMLTDSSGRVSIRNQSFEDTNNSSTTPLGAGATFTGAITELFGFSSITIYVFSDQDSATDGLVVEWSNDGTNFDENDTYTITGNDGKVYSFGPPARYFRVRYTNGATPQTAFRLQTILHPFNIKPSSHRISDDLSEEDDAELVISVLKAQNTAGQVQSIDGVTILGQNHLSVVTANILLEQATLNQTYSVSTDFNLPSGGTETPAILLRNPAGSGKAFYFSRTFFDILTKGNQATWRFYIAPTVTATGTLLSSASTHIGGGAAASVMEVYSGPTVSANGSKALTLSTGVDVSTTPIPFDLGTIIEPGFDALLTGTPSGNNTNTAITISWVEQ